MHVNSGASNRFFIQDTMTNPSMKVSVETKFLPADSSEEGATYCFSYFVTIENSGDVGAQLIARHWIIEDAKGLHQEVRGLGVVGQQPFLQPGESFSYNSGTRITSPIGSMHGTYFCVTEDAKFFDVVIPPFSLKAEGLGPKRDAAAVLH